MHPDVYFPRGKEIRFRDRRETVGRPLKEYQRIFSGLQVNHIGGKTGDITPAYLRISDTLIKKFKELAPDVRLMVILRNSVERSISAAAQVIRNKESSADQSDPRVYDLIDQALLNTTRSPTPNRLEVAPEQMARLKSTYRDDLTQLESLLNRSFGWDI
ncbi:hypothetical protein [Shimia sp. SK013]|uniref:hypothetical protein n=1 Tax=Shimia sp. SK013 TaxID=1389006 RepID=UPI00128EDDEA|nr:hypothetical protein [Shimia sp. SK013]